MWYYNNVIKKERRGKNVEMMGHSMCSITDFKNQPMQVFDRAQSEGGVYILRRSDPVGVVLSVSEYERLLKSDGSGPKGEKRHGRE